ncbi:MAG: glycosyltransferase [Cyanobacteria bacterium P01_F01_bin.150]
MRILFLHPNFPAQFRHLAIALAKDPKNEILFGTACQEGRIEGVRKAIYPAPEPNPDISPNLRMMATATETGNIVRRMAVQLKKRGFVPDIIMGHSGWGPTLFMKDVYPEAELICYLEWFYHAYGSDLHFDPNESMPGEAIARLRIKNAPFLIDLYSCDRALTPTQWQHQQFPKEFQSKIEVMHDGVDTDYFQPEPDAKLVLPEIDLDLSDATEIVTYATRGMEPYRGFPQFMEAASILQKRRPNCHIVIVGKDRIAYGPQRRDGKTYKQLMLERLKFDRDRLHFTGHLTYRDYRQVLRASSAHIYLSYPFVLSWSMLEAMSVGCAVVGSKTPPVEEVITDGENGLLVDFFSPKELADRVESVLEDPSRRQDLRINARQTIIERYDLATLLPQKIEWMTKFAKAKISASSSSATVKTKGKGFG